MSEGGVGRGGAVQPQLYQRLMQASVCVINHSDILRRGTIHFYPCSLIPSSSLPVLLFNTVPLSAQSASRQRQKRRRKRLEGLTKRTREKIKNGLSLRSGWKKAFQLVSYKITGSLMYWIMDKLYFLYVLSKNLCFSWQNSVFSVQTLGFHLFIFCEDCMVWIEEKFYLFFWAFGWVVALCVLELAYLKEEQTRTCLAAHRSHFPWVKCQDI